MNKSSESLPRRAGRTILAAWAGLLLLPTSIASAQGTPSGLEVPARVLPVPTTVSPQMQKIIGTPEAKETFEEIARFFDRHLGR